MRRLLLLTLVPLLACSREATTPAPPPSAGLPAPAASSTGPAAGPATYDQAIVWMKTAPRFAFTLEEGGARFEGEMKRPRVGSESVRFRSADEEWLGEAAAQGLVWKKRSGGDGWVEATPPPFAGRLYQRVTLGFDPAKKEGSARLESEGDGLAVYRFTDANSGEAWKVRVRNDGSIERIEIGDGIRLEIRK